MNLSTFPINKAKGLGEGGESIYSFATVLSLPLFSSHFSCWSFGLNIGARTLNFSLEAR
jgi:hypothetical protein